jgi:opine dehydrogenase
MKFCVIGAGSGGRAFAAYLSSKGLEVNLYNRSLNRIEYIQKKGKIKSKGKLKGKFKLNIVTQNLKLALKDSDVILVVVPASSHKDVAKKISPYLKQDQIILLNPGRTFGAIEFRKIIEKHRPEIDIFIAEAQTLLFTSRALKKHKVKILKIKNSLNFSAFPEDDTFFIFDTLRDIFPQLNPCDYYLQMTLQNVGMLLHPAIALFNAGFIRNEKDFYFYKEGAADRICYVIEQIEFEVNKVRNKVGLKPFKFCKWVSDSYGVEGVNIHDSIKRIKAYHNILAPNKLITRYFTEDVPTGLVPMSSLAQYFQISVPTINSVIHLSNILCGRDFYEEGRTIKNLNLENLIYENLERFQYSQEYQVWKEEELLS